MKLIYWAVGLVIGLPVLFLVVMYGASELGGEVVTLERADAGGEQSRVRIWIVDQGGVSWVEHGQPDAHWISRLGDAPDIVLTRDGQTVNYTGAPDPDAHALYHELRREKYGWADQLIEMLGGGGADCTGLPVRLQLSP